MFNNISFNTPDLLTCSKIIFFLPLVGAASGPTALASMRIRDLLQTWRCFFEFLSVGVNLRLKRKEVMRDDIP